LFLHIKKKCTFLIIVDHFLSTRFWFLHGNSLHIFAAIPEERIFYVKQMYLIVLHDVTFVQELHAHYLYDYRILFMTLKSASTNQNYVKLLYIQCHAYLEIDVFLKTFLDMLFHQKHAGVQCAN